jgi:putative hydrolase of the HAD superfamily
LPHARATVTALSADFRLVLITKGDLLHQERKLAQSGLGDLFQGVEIVSDKTEATYRTAFARHGTGADQAMMVGNSLKSDVIPALEAGSWGVHVPQDLEWSFEAALAPTDHRRFHVLPDLGALPDLVTRVRSVPHR